MTMRARATRSPRSSLRPLSLGIPMPRRRKLRPLCVPAWYGQGNFSGRRRHLDLATEHSGRHRNVDLGLEVVAFSLEAPIRFDGDDQIDVTRGSAVETRPALTGHAHPLAGVDTRREC